MERSRIVTAGLGIAHTAADSTHVLVFYINIYRIQAGSIVWAGRGKDNHKQIVFTRMYAQERIYCKNKRTNVQGRTLCVRNPVLFYRDEFFQALQAQFYRQFRNDQTLVRTVQTFKVLFRTEQLYTAVCTAISLQAFEYGLTIVQAHSRRAECDITIRHNHRIVPALTLIIGHYQHMIGKDMTEAQLAFVLGLFLRCLCELFLDFHIKNLFFKILPITAFILRNPIQPHPLRIAWSFFYYIIYFDK